MKLPFRLSVLFTIGLLLAGSTALGYYYYFVYDPPLKAAEEFMNAMEFGDLAALKRLVLISKDFDASELREPTEHELEVLKTDPFQRGRILDQRKRDGKTRSFDYLVYREPNGNIYALLVTPVGRDYRVVIPERRVGRRPRYLWEYTWTN